MAFFDLIEGKSEGKPTGKPTFDFMRLLQTCKAAVKNEADRAKHLQEALAMVLSALAASRLPDEETKLLDSLDLILKMMGEPELADELRVWREAVP